MLNQQARPDKLQLVSSLLLQVNNVNLPTLSGGAAAEAVRLGVGSRLAGRNPLSLLAAQANAKGAIEAVD